MKIALLQTGKTSEGYISQGTGIYSNRIRKYIPFEIFTVPEIRNTRNMTSREQKEREGEKILKYLSGDDFTVILDEKGRERTTIEFSEWLEKAFMLPKKRILFIIGGPWGFSDDVYNKSDERLSLSRFTFSHQMVRLLFLEQLYRALTVINGDPYHHE